MSNFLGDIATTLAPASILSANELMTREGINLQKGMNYRKGSDALSVFLVLPSHDGEYTDMWHPVSRIYTFEGHDSTTVEAGGKSKDQLLMYESGKLTDNGKFYKAVNDYKDGLTANPLHIQVYEKLDAGVWYDKGIFELVNVRGVNKEGRKIYQFDLRPVGEATDERMMSVKDKIAVWQDDRGCCRECGAESSLSFVMIKNGEIHLLCAVHCGKSSGLLGI